MAKNTRNQIMKGVDPKNLIKRSQIDRGLVAQTAFAAVGVRNPTVAGYKIEGHSGAHFETYFETVVKGSTTDAVFHKTKTRTVWAVRGTGCVALVLNGETTQQDLREGSSLTLDPGSIYRICANKGVDLNLVIVQDAKYEARLDVVEESSAPAKVSPDILIGITNVAGRTGGMSKAAAQAVSELDSRNNHIKSGKRANKPGRHMSDVENGLFNIGINPMPVDLSEF